MDHDDAGPAMVEVETRSVTEMVTASGQCLATVAEAMNGKRSTWAEVVAGSTAISGG